MEQELTEEEEILKQITSTDRNRKMWSETFDNSESKSGHGVSQTLDLLSSRSDHKVKNNLVSHVGSELVLDRASMLPILHDEGSAQGGEPLIAEEIGSKSESGYGVLQTLDLLNSPSDDIVKNNMVSQAGCELALDRASMLLILHTEGSAQSGGKPLTPEEIDISLVACDPIGFKGSVVFNTSVKAKESVEVGKFQVTAENQLEVTDLAIPTESPETKEYVQILSTSIDSGDIAPAFPCSTFSVQRDYLPQEHLKDMKSSWKLIIDSLSDMNDLVCVTDSSVDSVQGEIRQHEPLVSGGSSVHFEGHSSKSQVTLTSQTQMAECIAGSSVDTEHSGSSWLVDPMNDFWQESHQVRFLLSCSRWYAKCSANKCEAKDPTLDSSVDDIRVQTGQGEILSSQSLFSENEMTFHIKEVHYAESSQVCEEVVDTTMPNDAEDRRTVHAEDYPLPSHDKLQADSSCTMESMHEQSLFLEHMQDMRRSWELISHSLWSMCSSEYRRLGVCTQDSSVDDWIYVARDHCDQRSLVRAHFQDLVLSWHVLCEGFIDFWFPAGIENRDVDIHFQRIRNESSSLLEHYDDIVDEWHEVSNQFFREIKISGNTQEYSEHRADVVGELPSTSTSEEHGSRQNVYLLGHNQQLSAEKHSAKQQLSFLLCFFVKHLQDLLISWQDMFCRLRELWFLEDGMVDRQFEGQDPIVLGDRTGSLLYEHIRDMRRTWSMACLQFWQLWFPGEAITAHGQTYHGRFGHTIAMHRPVSARRSRSYLFRDQHQLTGSQQQRLCQADRISELLRLLMELFNSTLLRGFPCRSRRENRLVVETECHSINERLRRARHAVHARIVLCHSSLIRRMIIWQDQAGAFPRMWLNIGLRWAQIRAPFRQSGTLLTSSFCGRQMGVKHDKLTTLMNYFSERSVTLITFFGAKYSAWKIFCYQQLFALRSLFFVQLSAMRESEWVGRWFAHLHHCAERLRTCTRLCLLRFSCHFPRTSNLLSSRWFLIKRFMERYILHVLGRSDNSVNTLKTALFVRCCQDLGSCDDKNCCIIDDVLFICQEPKAKALVATLLFAFAVVVDVVAASCLPVLCTKATELQPAVEEITSVTLSHSVLLSLRGSVV